MGIPRRLAIGLVCALLGGAAIPTLALSDGGLLGGGSSQAQVLPSVSVPTVTVPSTPVQPQDDPVQQVVNTVTNTVTQVVGQVQKVVQHPTGGSQGGDTGPTNTDPSNAGDTTAQAAAGGAKRSSKGGSPSRHSGGGRAHRSSTGKSHTPGGASGSSVPAGLRTTSGSGAAPVAPAGTRTTGGRSESRGPDKSGRDSVLTRTVHDIVHVLPGWLKPLLAALALAILGLGLNSLLHSRRVRKLARVRDELLAEVGVLQAALLPEVPDRIRGLAVSVAYSPAEGPAAGGDFYDVFPLRGERVGIIVGDISGHGKRALEHTSLLRYTLRAYLDAGLEPRAAIAVAGQTLEDDLGTDFATVVVAIYDSENGTLTYSTAGHPPPLVLGPGQFEPVTACSAPPVGVDEPTGVRQTTVTLPRGTDVCLYTDGVVEARKDGQMWGRQQLAAVLEEHRPQPVAFDVLSKVSEEVDQTSDDMAVCVLTVEAKRAVPAFRLEELQLRAGDLDERHATRFLEACGVPTSRIPDALASVTTTTGEFGGAVLRVRIETGGTTVTVASPPGATTDLPALQGVRLAAPVDL